MTFHVVGPRRYDFGIRFPEALVRSFSLAPAEILDSSTSLQLVTMSLLNVHSLWVQPKYTSSRNEVGSSRSTCFISIFQVGFMFSVLPAILISSTYTDKNSPFARFIHEHSQFKTLSQPFSNRTCSNCLSHNGPAKGWPYKFLSRRTTASSVLDHDLGHLCFGRRIQISGHSGFGIFNNVEASSILTCVWADTASAAWPEHPGSLDMMSMTSAAVIWDDDDPCSVNTAYAPESSFTMSPRSTTLPLYFWYRGSNPELLRWQRSINDAKWTYLPLFLASSITSFLFLTFVSCHVGIFFSFSHSFSTAAFESGIFMAWGIGINLWTKL